MKFNKEDKYVKVITFASICVVLVFIACNIVSYIPSFLMKALHILEKIMGICSPAIMGFVIAYLLLIPTRAIEKFLNTGKYFRIKNKTVCRGIGVLVSYIAVFAILTGTFIGIYYMVGGQLSKSSSFENIVNTITEYFKNGEISVDSLKEQLESLKIPNVEILTSKLASLANKLTAILAKIASVLFGTVITAGVNVFNIVIAIVISIYFIMSHEYYTKVANKAFYAVFRESAAGKKIRTALTIVNDTFSSYIRGQLIDAFIVAVLSALVLYILDIDYAIIIGIISGICNLIPYVGPLIGTVLAGIIALMGGDIFICLWAVLGMQLVQQIDANIICPKIVGGIVGLPSAFVIIAILIGGSYGGLFGMLTAVPIAASSKKIFSEWFGKNCPEFESFYDNSITEAALRETEKKEASKAAKKKKKTPNKTSTSEVDKNSDIESVDDNFSK